MSAGTTRIERDRRGRRVRERDRHGAEVATLTWRDDGMVEATVRLPDGAWLRVERGAAHDPRWGACDVIHHADVPLTHFAAVRWDAIDAIPPLAEPARLPPGGGTAVLNLIAGLAADQRSGPLPYRGPYPTEQLFLALLESWTWTADAEIADPLAAFMTGQLAWRPAPHRRTFEPHGVYVQAREHVEKVVWRGRPYYRVAWQGVERRAVHRVRDEGERVVASLWALERPIEDHVVLTADGTVLDVEAPAVGGEAPRAMPPIVVAGVVAIVVAASAPPLAAAIRAEAARRVFEWAPLAGDLAALAPGRAHVSTRLLRALGARLGEADQRADQVRLGFAALAEAAHALGDGLRNAAQARLAAAPAAARAEALVRSSAQAAARAREIGEAVEALLEDAAQPLA